MVIYVSKNHHYITQIAGKSFCEYPRNQKFLRCLYIYIHHAKLMSLPHFQTDPNIILPAAYLREYQVSISPLLVESWETDQYPINPKKRLKPHYIPLFRNKVIQPNMLLVMCIYLSCLSIYLSICLSIYLSVYLSIFSGFHPGAQAPHISDGGTQGDHGHHEATQRGAPGKGDGHMSSEGRPAKTRGFYHGKLVAEPTIGISWDSWCINQLFR